jgi:hypothetical protein
MKTCSYQGCNNQINVWKMFCDQHEKMMMQQQQQQQRVMESPPAIPLQKVQMPTESSLPAFATARPVQEPKTFSEKEKENVRRDAMRFAVDLITQTDIEQKPYDQLISEIRTLTNDLQRILQE